MIKSIICQGSFTAKNFEPRSLLTSHDINSKIFNIGDLITFGRFKGEIEKEGGLLFDGSIDSVLTFIESNKSNFQVTAGNLNVTILVAWKDQCNFELTTEELARFAALNINVGITCYEAD